MMHGLWLCMAGFGMLTDNETGCATGQNPAPPHGHFLPYSTRLGVPHHALNIRNTATSDAEDETGRKAGRENRTGKSTQPNLSP